MTDPQDQTPEQAPEQQNAQNGSNGHAADARIAELEAKLQEEKNRYLYLYAEFENFRKRQAKERQDLIKFGWEPVARELLQIIDNLERALQHMPEGTSKTLTDGIRMILGQFTATLEKSGVQRIQSEKQSFDPNVHEAVAQESSEELPEGTVVREAQSGYLLHGRLLRPARVVVSAGNKTA